MKYAKKKYKHPQPATIIYITLNGTKVLKCKRNAKGRKWIPVLIHVKIKEKYISV